MDENILKGYGYSLISANEFAKEFGKNKELLPARVIAEHKSLYVVVTEMGELPANLSGKYMYELDARGGRPAVGDYVAVQVSETRDRAVIQGYLPRKSLFYRADSFNGGMQVLAANFDTVFICMSLNQDFNIPRLERFLVMAKESGGQAVVVLTKADLSGGEGANLEICQAICGDVPVYEVSAFNGQGLEVLRPYFAAGQTVVSVGSSGVGKSTLVNALFGEDIMKTAEIREDDGKGRHTTVHRQIICLPSGGLYMDTPGLREVGLYAAEDSVSDLYGDIENLISQCRFSDCRHGNEPGCAIRAAMASGSLSKAQFDRYLKYKKEAAYATSREDYLIQRTQFFKQVGKMNRQRKTKKR